MPHGLCCGLAATRSPKHPPPSTPETSGRSSPDVDDNAGPGPQAVEVRGPTSPRIAAGGRVGLFATRCPTIPRRQPAVTPGVGRGVLRGRPAWARVLPGGGQRGRVRKYAGFACFWGDQIRGLISSAVPAAADGKEFDGTITRSSRTAISEFLPWSQARATGIVCWLPSGASTMPDNTQDAATLRARLNHHAGAKVAAESERARLIADRAEVGALLSEADLDQVDQDIARLGDVIERAGSRVALLAPVLAKAETAEAEADDRQRATVERVAYGETRRVAVDMFAGDPDRAKTAAQAALAANGPVVSEWNPALFDRKPAPVVSRVDEKTWFAAREARLAAEAGVPMPRTAPTSADFGRPGPSAAASLGR